MLWWIKDHDNIITSSSHRALLFPLSTSLSHHRFKPCAHKEPESYLNGDEKCFLSFKQRMEVWGQLISAGQRWSKPQVKRVDGNASDVHLSSGCSWFGRWGKKLNKPQGMDEWVMGNMLNLAYNDSFLILDLHTGMTFFNCTERAFLPSTTSFPQVQAYR